MDLRLFQLNRWLLVAALAAGMACSAAAQSSIIFSKPTDNLEDKANSFLPQAHTAPGLFNAPTPLFGSTPAATFDVLPGARPPAPVSPELVKQWQKFLDDKKNWTMLTPEEILGVPTAEKILGVTDPDNDEKLSAQDRYLKRQDRQRLISATNALRRSEGFLREDSNRFQSSRADDQKNGRLDGKDSRTGMEQQRFFGQLLNAASGVSFGGDQNQKADSPWTSAFTQPAALPKLDPEQVAAMDRFRALMDPPSVTPETSLNPSRFSTPVTPKLDPNMQVMPQFNPLGNTFAPLQNSGSRPMGLTPLPGIMGQPKLTVKKTEPLVKPPPWLSEEPQPFGMQQRKF